MTSIIELEKMETLNVNGAIIPIIPYGVARQFAPSLSLLMKYLPNYKFYADYFGEDLLLEVLQKGEFHFSIFAQEDSISENVASHFTKQSYVLSSGTKIKFKSTIHRGEWSKDVEEKGYNFWVPNKYNQHLPYIQELYFAKYPWFNQFRKQLAIYSVWGEDDYIYLDTGDKKKGSFYIQVKHLKNLDVQGLVKAHMEYQISYYRWPGGWGKDVTKKDVLQWRSEHSSAVWDPVVLKFLEYVELSRLYRDNGKTEKIYY